MIKQPVWRTGTAMGVCLAVGILVIEAAQAAPRAGRAVATRVVGTVEYKGFDQSGWRPIKVGMALSEGLMVRTSPGSSADFALTTGALIRLNPGSIIRLEKLSEESQGIPAADKASSAAQLTKITVEQGQIINKVRKLSANSSYTVLTPIGPVNVTGTTFVVTRDGNRFTVRAIEGSVTFKVAGRLVTLTQGQEISFDYDPLTGLARNFTAEPTLAPTDDLVAAQVQTFATETKGLEVVVLGEGVVNLDQLLETAASDQGAPLPGTPQLILVGNPGSTTSPSVP